MDEQDLERQHARERERADRARDREQHALGMKQAAEREADRAPGSRAAEAHRDEAEMHDRAAQLHREAIEFQERHERDDAD